MSLFEHLAATDDTERVTNRKAAAVAVKRFDDQFGAFLKGASSSADLQARIDLIDSDFREMVASVVADHGGDSKRIEAFVKDSILGPVGDAIGDAAGAVGGAASDAADAVQTAMGPEGWDAVQNAAQSIPNPGGIANTLPGAGPAIQALQGTGVPGIAQDLIGTAFDSEMPGSGPSGQWPVELSPEAESLFSVSSVKQGSDPTERNVLGALEDAESIYGEDEVISYLREVFSGFDGAWQSEDIASGRAVAGALHDAESIYGPTEVIQYLEEVLSGFDSFTNYTRYGSSDAAPLGRSAGIFDAVGDAASWAGGAVGDTVDAVGDATGWAGNAYADTKSVVNGLVPATKILNPLLPEEGTARLLGDAIDNDGVPNPADALDMMGSPPATTYDPFAAMGDAFTYKDSAAHTVEQKEDGYYVVEDGGAETVAGPFDSNDEADDRASELNKLEPKEAARRPKMCPYHSELTESSLHAGEPQYAAYSALVGSPAHCKGGYEGKCNFKPAMVGQDFWDEKEKQAEQRKQQKADQIENQPSAVGYAPDNEIVMASVRESAIKFAALRQAKDCNCWKGYKRVEGTEPCPGSCEKCDSAKESSIRVAEADKDGGGATKNEKNWAWGHKAPKGDESALGGPSPKMDKTKWKPAVKSEGEGNLKPVDTQYPNSPNPTIQQVLWEHRPTEDDKKTYNKAPDQFDAVTEKQDLPSADETGQTTDKNLDQGSQGGTFPNEGQANPVTSRVASPIPNEFGDQARYENIVSDNQSAYDKVMEVYDILDGIAGGEAAVGPAEDDLQKALALIDRALDSMYNESEADDTNMNWAKGMSGTPRAPGDHTAKTANEECLDGPEGCEGHTEYREPLSATGKPFPRCDKHWDQRLQKQDEINQRYPQNAPSDFDPGYAGERWDDEY
jgi:hypothetical protein